MPRERVYTKAGDDGTTGLFYGGRVAKDSAQPTAYGAVDEAQAVLGLARAAAAADSASTGTASTGTASTGSTSSGLLSTGSTSSAGGDGELVEMLVGLMRDLYVLMAELATLPQNRHKLKPGASAVTAEMVAALEEQIDALDERFEPPTEFVVPGGNVIAAWLDLGRTVVRRAERSAVAAAEPPSLVVPYLNRLSDLLWTMARWQEGTSLIARDA